MTNDELQQLNEQAQQDIDSAISEIERNGEGFSPAKLLMNPGKELARFGGALNHLMSGVNRLRQVNNELVARTTDGH